MISILPIASHLKSTIPNIKTAVSFFSSSGYENLTQLGPFDCKVYSPIEWKSDIEKWLDIINPKVLIISQNEIWPLFLREVIKRKIKFLYVDSYFNPSIKNRLWLSLNTGLLNKASSIYVQNETAYSLLNQFLSCPIRFTGSFRNYQTQIELKNSPDLPKIESFKGNHKLMVLGSIEQSDFEAILHGIQSLGDNWKILVAPHDITTKNIDCINSKLNDRSALYSSGMSLGNRHCILDEFGVLKYAYQYADLVYVGGGFGKGVHNVMEPLFFTESIIIGPNYIKFVEVREWVKTEKVRVIKNRRDFVVALSNLSKKSLQTTTAKAKDYQNIESAISKITDFVKEQI